MKKTAAWVLIFALVLGLPSCGKNDPETPPEQEQEKPPEIIYSPESDFEYAKTSGGVMITRYTGSSAEVNIPYTIAGITVVEISKGAFHEKSEITEVVIPAGVLIINDYAFMGCIGLTNVIIPNSVVSIGEKAFANCTGLTGIDIPDSVTDIGVEAFLNCTALTNATFKGETYSIRTIVNEDYYDLPQEFYYAIKNNE